MSRRSSSTLCARTVQSTCAMSAAAVPITQYLRDERMAGS